MKKFLRREEPLLQSFPAWIRAEKLNQNQDHQTIEKNNTMNAILTRSIVQQTMSEFTSAAPNHLAKASSGRCPVDATGPSRSGLSYTAVLSASAPLETYQHVTHFPELVSAFGERAFADYWN